MSEEQTFLLQDNPPGFGNYGDEDELLHPAVNAASRDEGITETQYFGFSVPEERIHGLCYLWHHPNLGTVSGGAAAWQGIKTHHLAAELYDHRMFMSDELIAGGIDHHRLSMGYQVDILEPFRKMRIRYEDADRHNAFDITYTAIAAPAMMPSRKHFEQPLRTRGSVTLRGRTYEINGYNVRDRSWGEVRPESPIRHPPLVWLTGVFSDEFSFNCLLTDDPQRSPEWLDLYTISTAQALRGGWIYSSGKYSRIARASKLTKRDPIGLFPISHQLQLWDESGRSYEIGGTIVSSCPGGYWPNCSIFWALTRWECGGQVGWGDSQEAQWTDYVHAMHAKRRPA